MDAVVEHYTPAVDELGSEVAALESRVLEEDEEESELLNEVVKIRKEVYHLRQIIIPQKEVMSKLSRPGYKLIRPNLLPYYRTFMIDIVARALNIRILTNILVTLPDSNRTEKSMALFTGDMTLAIGVGTE